MIFKNNIGWYAGSGSVRHDFYINGEIVAPEDYEEMLQVLHTASEHDLIYIHINTPGGDFNATCQICDAIMKSKAKAVIACAEGQVCSAGTMIFLACNGWYVSPFSTFMFHTSTGGQIGKMPDTLKQAEAHREHINRLCSMIYEPFFSDSEINDIINNNQDLWLTPDEVSERLNIMADAFEQSYNEEKCDSVDDVKDDSLAELEARIEDLSAKLVAMTSDGKKTTRKRSSSGKIKEV